MWGSQLLHATETVISSLARVRLYLYLPFIVICVICYFLIIIIICLIFQVAEYFEKARKLEGRVASDEDLKTSDLLRYYVRDTEAAKILLYRGARCLADYENANKALDKARVRGKEVAAVSRMLLLD